MTSNSNSKSIKTKILLFLTIVCLLCTSMFALFACDDESKDVEINDPTISIDTESDDVLIKNSTFKIDASNKDLSTFPLVSPNGWNKSATDESSAYSTVSSGVINTSNDGWKELLNTLYNDTDFVNYVQYLEGFDDSQMISEIRAEKGDDEYNPSKSELKEYAVSKKIVKFANPGKSFNDADNYVYMLNNVAKKSNLGFGTAQSVTSTSTVTMEKGKTYELSVYVKTMNVKGVSENVGANIRLVNTFNANSQADYRISNINTNGEWQKYTILIKADDNYNCNFTLVLGLGYGNGTSADGTYYTEGTAFFDEITLTEKTDAITIAPQPMVYNGEEKIEAILDTNNTCYYDMSFSHSEGSFFTDITTSSTYNLEFTKSNVVVGYDGSTPIYQTSENKVGASSTKSLTYEDTTAVISVNKASATLDVKNTSLFKVGPGKGAFISFEVKNQLEGPASTNVYVDVFEKVSATEFKKYPAILTMSEVNDDFSRRVIYVKNNFETGDPREFFFNIIVGPNDVASVKYDADFATGKVYLRNLKVKNDVTIENNEDELVKYFTSVANATVALHAGYEDDFSAENNNQTYAFKTQPGNFGDILHNPTTIKGYAGIIPGHSYITNTDEAENTINDRVGTGTTSGVAGLINTKYLNAYTSVNETEVKTKLGFSAGDDDYQPIMIYNKTANHYGFAGEKLKISAGNKGLISVTLKVCDDAKANVYLVDLTGSSKNVMTFDDFTVNTDVVSGVENGKAVDGSSLKFALSVDSSMMDADGWATVNFYVGAGNTDKIFRLEIWNGDRNGESANASAGYVFIKSINTSLTSGFNEAEKWNQTFTIAGNPLYEYHKASFTTLYAYQRQLAEIEEQFNAEYPDKEISYSPNYVWAQGPKVVYGMYSAINPVVSNPYDGIEEEPTEETGCAAETDPSTFWLSFSSILLAVVLVLALAVLIVKRIRIRRKANRSDAKSHYTVTSRISKPKKSTQPKEEVAEAVEEVAEEETSENTEGALDNGEAETEEYIYGEVESFDDVQEENSDDSSNNETNE